MAALAITTSHYKLFPSPRNLHPTVFDLQSFVPHPYALIYLPDFNLAGKATLFAACRLSDMTAARHPRRSARALQLL